MDLQEMGTELQKFADANGLDMDVASALDNMDAGEFVELSQAMDNSDNRSIMKILQRYRARAFESFEYFKPNSRHVGSEICEHVKSMRMDELQLNYERFVIGALKESSHLSTQELKTLVYEDITSSLQASQIADQNNASKSVTQDPAVQAKMKQAELQKSAANPNSQVTVPGQNGNSELEKVLGVDIGPTPDKSLVVTKDPNNQNQVSVFGMNDVEPVTEEPEVEIEIQPEEPEQEMEPEIAPAPEERKMFRDEEPETNNQDEVIAAIMDFCSRINGLR